MVSKFRDTGGSDATVCMRRQPSSRAADWENIGKVEDAGVYANIEPVRAWTNPEPLYQSFKETMFSQFSETFVTPTVDSQIRDYSSFEKVFLGFMAMITPQFPFTRTKHAAAMP